MDDVEGADDSSGDGWGDYPLDSVFVRTELRTVAEVVGRIEKGRYILDPDFQREFVWPTSKQSKLIESCVMRIPLPVFYVAEAPDGRIIVVDGLQRLTTLTRFINNQFRLTGLVAAGSTSKGEHPLEGKYFEDLTINLRERVLDTQLTMYILDAKAPERARLDIFERVNSGEPLTRQQMRNALYNGPATTWLREATEGHAFQVATDRRLNTKTMRDREAVNRFCAFYLLGELAYTTGDMDAFLASGLLKLSKLSEKERVELRRSFDAVMDLNRILFGEHAFRKSLFVNQTWAARSIINISLFEVCAVSMLDIADSALGNEHVRRALKAKILELEEDEGFIKAITYSTNSTAAVRARFSAARNAVMSATL
ncbi:DUF262 domain-containing protein [Pseudoxanthomonas daejeonensis]|nr:DUF262 domain-containing protein [Pseudoxanthomonas daejeonensis]